MMAQASRGNELRRLRRRELGRLGDLQLAPKTLERYRLAVKEFITWTDGAAWPDSTEQFDELCGDFIEALWEDGYNRGSAADFLSGIQHALPWCRGSLKHSWRLYSTWTSWSRLFEQSR
jgi:hypothetical protein